MLIPLLFTLLTHNCAAMPSLNHLIKFDKTVVGLISKDDESEYKGEMQQLTDYFRVSNLSINVD